eukprot:scaffold36291_cov48-Attheya_sp.AAC.1
MRTSTTSLAIPKRRPGLEAQERDASTEPIFIEINAIDSAKNCRLVRNAMRQRAKRERAERKRAERAEKEKEGNEREKYPIRRRHQMK